MGLADINNLISNTRVSATREDAQRAPKAETVELIHFCVNKLGYKVHQSITKTTRFCPKTFGRYSVIVVNHGVKCCFVKQTDRMERTFPSISLMFVSFKQFPQFHLS